MRRKHSGYPIRATALGQHFWLVGPIFLRLNQKAHGPSWLVSARGSRPKLSTCSEDRIAQHHMSPLWSGNFLAAYLRYRFVEYIWMSSTSNFHVHLGRKSWVWFLSSTRRAELRSGKHGGGYHLQLSWQHLWVYCGGLQARSSKLQITIWIVYYMVYRLYFHLLSKFPGPWLPRYQM
jgi:hypothetical protein